VIAKNVNDRVGERPLAKVRCLKDDQKEIVSNRIGGTSRTPAPSDAQTSLRESITRTEVFQWACDRKSRQ